MELAFVSAVLAFAWIHGPIHQSGRTPLQEVLAKSGIPRTLSLDQLPDGIKCLDIKYPGLEGRANPFTVYTAYASLMLGDMAGNPVLDYFQACWTTGEELVDESGHRFLAVYKMDPKALGASDAPDSPTVAPTPPPINFQEAFKKPLFQLSLIRESSIISLSPRPDLSKANFIKLSNSFFLPPQQIDMVPISGGHVRVSPGVPPKARPVHKRS